MTTERELYNMRDWPGSESFSAPLTALNPVQEKPRVFVAVIVRNPGGKFLFLHFIKKPVLRWRFAGGKQDAREMLIVTAARELREEVGIEPLNLYLHSTHTERIDGGLWRGFYFVCDQYTGVPAVQEPTKHDVVAFRALHELSDSDVPAAATQLLTELNTEDANAVTSTNHLASSTPEQPVHTAGTAKVAHRSHLSNGEQQTGNTTTDTCANTDVEETGRFFYTAKSSTVERNAGLSDKNVHPTLKPIDLTRYLATLLLPPSSVKRRRLLVPFSGSGSEMIGGILAGWDEVVGVEQSAEYCAIAEQRLRFWSDNAAHGATTSEILKVTKRNGALNNVTPIPVATQTEVNQCTS